MVSPPSGRLSASPADLRRRAHARIAERIDPAKTRHKPLSLIRTDARRVLEQLLDADAPTMGRSERDRFIEDLIAESVGLGVLEELFRDDAVKEILVLAANQVIVKKADNWEPSSVRFRDAEQVLSVLARYAESGEPVAAGAATGAYDVRLVNGFRVMAILPPEVMSIPPLAAFVRGLPATKSGSEIVSLGNGSATIATPAPRPGPFAPRQQLNSGSGVVTLAAVGSGTMSQLSGRMAPAPITTTPAPPATPPDPYARVRQRVTEKIILKFAAAGVYDLNVIPAAELRKIVSAHVIEFGNEGRYKWDEAFADRLALEILAGMNR